MTAPGERPSYVLRRLAEIFAATEAWQEQANCRGIDTNLFFPEQHATANIDTNLFFPEQHATANIEKARAVCRACVVRQECLEYAVRAKEQFGVWGSMSLKERRALRWRDGAA